MESLQGDHKLLNLKRNRVITKRSLTQVHITHAVNKLVQKIVKSENLQKIYSLE